MYGALDHCPKGEDTITAGNKKDSNLRKAPQTKTIFFCSYLSFAILGIRSWTRTPVNPVLESRDGKRDLIEGGTNKNVVFNIKCKWVLHKHNNFFNSKIKKIVEANTKKILRTGDLPM